MSNEIRRRIVRPATDEERERHRQIREEIANELPELATWARREAHEQKKHVAIGTTFSENEAPVVEAIDAYAAKHSLPHRGAVVRDALSKLLGIPIARDLV